jgi:hypothetical protein
MSVLQAPYAQALDLVTHSRLKQISLAKLLQLNDLQIRLTRSHGFALVPEGAVIDSQTRPSGTSTGARPR